MKTRTKKKTEKRPKALASPKRRTKAAQAAAKPRPEGRYKNKASLEALRKSGAAAAKKQKAEVYDLCDHPTQMLRRLTRPAYEAWRDSAPGMGYGAFVKRVNFLNAALKAELKRKPRKQKDEATDNGDYCWVRLYIGSSLVDAVKGLSHAEFCELVSRAILRAAGAK